MQASPIHSKAPGASRVRPARRTTFLACLAAAWLVESGCFLNDIERPPLSSLLLPGNQSDRIGVVASDLGSAGRFTLLTPEGFPIPTITNVHSDARARYQDGRVYIINRLNRDNIQVLNPQFAYLTELEYSVGAASNPQDFVKLNENKAYVSRYNSADVLIVHPGTGARLGAISLAPYADADGLPEMSGMHIEGNRLYVAVQRLDRNSVVHTLPPTDYSALIEIDVTTDTVVAEHRLNATNPFSRLRRVEIFGQPHLLIACPGFLGVNFRLDGGIEAFNLSSRSVRPGLLYAEVVAGGDILNFVVKNDALAYALVEFQDFSVSLRRFNPTTGTNLGDLAFYPASSGYVSGLLLHPNGYLYAADAGFSNPGVVIYDTNRGDARLTASPLDVGLRPTQLIHIP